MQVNSTASYSPSYTTNYGEAQQAKSRAETKVTYKPSVEPNDPASSASQAKTGASFEQKVGQRLDAKA